MKTQKAPASPDPVQTAAAQTGTNVSTAVANAALGNVNQVTPDGSLTYTQSGTHTFKDPTTGVTSNIPTWTATQTLSPAQQAIKDQNDATELNLGKIANQQSSFFGDYLSKPVDLSNDATEGRLMELGRKRLDPLLADRRSAMEASLANQGIRIGSTAYDKAMEGLNQGENDAFNQLLLSGRQQSVQEALTARNQPLNEISALMSGSQVSQPQFVNPNTTSIPTVDYAGLVQQDYANRYGQYQQSQANRNSLVGGLFSLGSSAILASDRRLKRDVRRVGRLPLGIDVYAYRYVWGGPRQLGVMAQDVLRVLPGAVVRMASGFLAVDYAKLLREGAR